MSTTRPRRTVLISGASIAGPTAAYWLNRYGFDVTVVEKASSYRSGGHAVDLRGPTTDIAHRMGILEIARSNEVATSKVTFVGEHGDLIGTVDVTAISHGDAANDVELPRGELVVALIKAAGDSVEWIFGDSIAALDEDEKGVNVTFSGGSQRTFDLVLGADGVRSRTRRLAIDPNDESVQYLGYCFALFAMPNYLGIRNENRSWNIGGKMAAMLPTADDAYVNVMLAFQAPTPPAEIYGDLDRAKEFVAKHFSGYGWEIPQLLKALRASDQVYFDSANYVDAAHWSKGRVGVIGDAGFGPSLFTGQGSALAMIGAYILAGELARTADHNLAFAEFERIFRPFVIATQATVPGMIFQLVPRTEDDLQARNAGIRNPTLIGGHDHPTPPTITLPDYGALLIETTRA